MEVTDTTWCSPGSQGERRQTKGIMKAEYDKGCIKKRILRQDYCCDIRFVFYRYAGSPGNPFFVRQGGADRSWSLFLAGGRRILPELIRDHFNHLCLQIHVKGQLADKGKQLQVLTVLIIHRSI